MTPLMKKERRSQPGTSSSPVIGLEQLHVTKSMKTLVGQCLISIFYLLSTVGTIKLLYLLDIEYLLYKDYLTYFLFIIIIIIGINITF